jgi:hypothetical protein
MHPAFGNIPLSFAQSFDELCEPSHRFKTGDIHQYSQPEL